MEKNSRKRNKMNIDEQTLIVINKIKNNISNGVYEKLSKEESLIVRNAYESRFRRPPVIIGDLEFRNKVGTLVAIGYNGWVTGDYGIYLEFSQFQIQLENIQNKFLGEPNRTVKYIWMQTNDDELTKIYWQKKRVSYADYKPGMYYVSPADLYISGKRLYDPMTEIEVI